MALCFDNYIFDLYGTLIDIHTDEESVKLWVDVYKYIERKIKKGKESRDIPDITSLKKMYLELCEKEEKKLVLKNGARYPEIRIENVWAEIMTEYAYKMGNPERFSPESSIIKELCIFFRETSRDKFEKYRGVDETLQRIRDEGKKVFLLSNAQRAFTEKELKDALLENYFDDIFISSDKGIRKPQREFLEELMKKNSLDPKTCVMIGNDIKSDIGVAASNSVRSIFLNTYDYSEKKIDRELRELGIKGSAYAPYIIHNGDITGIFGYIM